MRTPPPTLSRCVIANFTSGITLIRLRYGAATTPRTRRERGERRVSPVLIEGRPFEEHAEPFRADLPRFDAQGEARVFLDQIVADVDGNGRSEQHVAAADAERQVRTHPCSE